MTLPQDAPEPSVAAAGAGLFPNTAWSFVARARDCREEFGLLLHRYRAPLVAFARVKLTVSADAAEDAVSDLFAALLEKDSPLQKVHPAGGRFRSWLATCLQNEVFGSWRKEQAEKRGGGQAPVSLDEEREGGALEVPSPEADPAVEFDRAFAQTLMATVTERFLAEAPEADSLEGRVRRMAFAGTAASEQELMDAYGVSRSTVTRRRQEALGRFRELLRAEVAATVEDEREIESEMAWLRQCLR